MTAVVQRKPRFSFEWCIGNGEHWPIFLAACMMFALSPAEQCIFVDGAVGDRCGALFTQERLITGSS